VNSARNFCSPAGSKRCDFSQVRENLRSKNRLMLNWKFFRSPPPQESECDFAHNALTAAFDGQADAAQLAFVAQHRARCMDCQRLWSEWEKTRGLLRAVPAPIAPATLPEQILLTCRSLPDAEFSGLQTELMQTEPVPLRADLIAYLEAPGEEFSVARLAPFAIEAAPPPLLSRRILERTAQAEAPRASLWPAIRDFFLVGSTPGARAPLAARWGFSLAVPALAAWLIFATQTSFVETPAPVTARVPMTLPNPKTAAPEPAKKLAPSASTKKAAPRIAALAPNAKPQDTKPQTVKVQAAETHADKNEETVSPRVIEVSLASSRISRRIRSAKKTATNIFRARRARTMPLVDKTVSVQPKLARVAFAPSTPVSRLAARRQNANLRISKPIIADSHMSTPRMANLHLADMDFNESLSVIARQRDNRPEDLGRALDEYSASLLAERTGENEEDEWG
jgi:hypothetical protein